MKSNFRRYWTRFRDHHPRYMIYVRRYALLWLTLILLDAHRYGSWITGDKSYIYPFCYWLLPISLLPLLPWGFSAWMSWAQRTGRQYTFKFVLLYIPFNILAVAVISEGHIFKADWYDKTFFGLLRSDSSFLAAVGLVILMSFCEWFYVKDGKSIFRD